MTTLTQKEVGKIEIRKNNYTGELIARLTLSVILGSNGDHWKDCCCLHFMKGASAIETLASPL